MNSENKKTILLVEDEPIVAMSGKLTLKKYGYNVLIADTGEKALEIFKADDSIDLILMDIDLGLGLDGTETAVEILKERMTPILFLSSHTEPEVVEKTEQITSYGYVVKNSGDTVLDASIKMAFKLFHSQTTAKNELSERTRAEKELAVSEARYRRLFESAQDGIIILNAETGLIDDVNPYLVNMLGYSKEQFMEKVIWEIGLFKDIMANREKFLELQRKGYVTYEDLPLETSDGRKVNVEFVSNVYLVNGVKVIQCNIRDITNRRRAEAGLAHTMQQLAANKIATDEAGEFAENIINTIREPLLVLNNDFKAIKASRSFYDFFKTTPDQTIGQYLFDLGNKQWNIPELRQLLETTPPEETIFEDYEVDHDLAITGRRIMLLNARKVNGESGKNRIILLAFDDITARKTADDEIKLKNQMLLELNESKDKLFSIIAHDLKSPFQGLMGLTKIMADDIKAFTVAELAELASNIHKTAYNLFSLLKNLLEWAQMQKGALDFDPVELSLSHLITKNIDMVWQSGKKKEIKIINNISGEISAFGDEKMLNSVIMNLLSNAIKFTKRGGIVTVNSNEKENNLIEISVSDTGIGMKESLVQKLFKPGEKIKTQGTEGEVSTGLGLLLCKEFVTKHGGSIRAESVEGKGSTFSFTLQRVGEIAVI